MDEKKILEKTERIFDGKVTYLQIKGVYSGWVLETNTPGLYVPIADLVSDFNGKAVRVTVKVIE